MTAPMVDQKKVAGGTTLTILWVNGATAKLSHQKMGTLLVKLMQKVLLLN
jgi:uncharacterized membrane protein YfcA